MQFKSLYSLLFFFFLMVSCSTNEAPKGQDNAPVKYGTTMQVDTSVHSPKYSPAMVNNKRDFICGMPVSAGIADTAHYKGKVYGFCATECKDEFLKKPEAHIAQK